MSTKINVGDCFQPGEVWQTPRGLLYRVMSYEHKDGKVRKQAVLRFGADGGGRKVLRDWDSVEGWVIHQHAAVTKDEVVQRLRTGYELANRGTGWWLATPRKAYARPESVKLDDSLVDELEAEGRIKITMLSTSARADLV